MDRRLWFSRRAVRLHIVILVVVPACLALCLWQVSRALGGNELSWAYVFEWPIFAAYAIYMWWRFVHETPEGAPGAGPAPPSAGGAASAPLDEAAAARRAQEDAELQAYNVYLAQLAEQDKTENARVPGVKSAERLNELS